MNILLKEINEENFRQCTKLTVADGQEHFVASNVYSIAESKIYSYLTPLAVNNGENLVGFAMYGRDPKDKTYWIMRLMIDAQFQGNGFGKAAILALIERIKQLPEGHEIFLSYVPANIYAEKLYRSIGFERTGKTDDDGEIIMRFSSLKTKTRP